GVRSAAGPDPLTPFADYVGQRFADDPHVWATVLFDEVVELGFDRSYQSFTRLLRARGLRPHCEACSGVTGRATVEIEHPPGEEIQWDWLELPEAPWGGRAHVLVGSLPFSGRFRAVFAEAEDQPHLIWAMHQVMERLGGTARRWRVDRLATVIRPGTADVQASFVPVAKHYRVGVDPCPPRRGNRKGSVEKSIHYLTQRWWRTARVTTMAEAQASLDRFCARIADKRRRPAGRFGPEVLARAGAVEGIRPIVGLLATLEDLAPLPVPFPATVEATVNVGPSALVRFDGNAYSVPAGLLRAAVVCRWRLGTDRLDIATAAGMTVASHRLVPSGAGQIVRSAEHAAQLENVVLGGFTTDRPCSTKTNRPPSSAALDLAARITGHGAAEAVVVDLAAYQAAADHRGGAR
ncbi:MAG: IS21 family transposase, partial [Actinomycetota bacterium]|nr:IS21 family transposase [Actinomycetota bacterium]